MKQPSETTPAQFSKETKNETQGSSSSAGHSMAPPSFNLTAGPIQRATDGPTGKAICTLFGDYYIVPNDTNKSFADAVGEQITQAEYDNLKAVWDKLKDGTGKIAITENDKTGTAHAGFKTMILGQLGKLLSKSTGRGLVAGLVNGSTQVTFRPSSSQIYGGGNAIRGGSGTLENSDGTAGTGGTTIIQIDDNLQDSDVVVYDKDGNEISLPVFVTIGHELIHAQHNANGRNRRGNPGSSTDYSNQEEEETISTGTLTENDIRSEHGLDQRHGHFGKDTR